MLIAVCSPSSCTLCGVPFYIACYMCQGAILACALPAVHARIRPLRCTVSGVAKTPSPDITPENNPSFMPDPKSDGPPDTAPPAPSAGHQAHARPQPKPAESLWHTCVCRSGSNAAALVSGVAAAMYAACTASTCAANSTKDTFVSVRWTGTLAAMRSLTCVMMPSRPTLTCAFACA